MKKTLFYLLMLTITIISCSHESGFNGAFRKLITIDHAYVYNTDQANFPVLISLTDPSLKSVSHGGYVVYNGNPDICFTLPDGTTKLPHEIIHYEPGHGRVKAWVRIPTLYAEKDTELIMYYGAITGQASSQDTQTVWDDNYVLAEHVHGDADPSITIPHDESFNFTHEITVEALITTDTYKPEVIQPLVSKWKQLTSFDESAFDAYDAGSTDGLTCCGYLGAVFDGRYVRSAE